MMTTLETLLSNLAGLVWGLPLLILLFGTHLYLTFRLRFIQKYIGTAIRLYFVKEKKSSGDISQFGALTTALAATIGTGNIVGVATAIAIGGPGAVLWIWLTGLFGIATKYGEALLSIKYRIRTADGTMAGGPMYVLDRALNFKFWAGLFAVFTALAAFGIGCTVQSNSIAILMLDTFYIGSWLVLLGLGFATIPATIVLIVKDAFTGQAALGGFMGASMLVTMRYGIARGLFSNESGMGSAPIIAAAAQTKNPVRQALVSASGTFWDTVVVCALTGLVLVNTGEWTNGLNGAALTRAAFQDFPVAGPLILTIGLLTFVFSTILGWSYYGEKAAEYLFGEKAIPVYRWLWVFAVMAGSVASLPMVWTFADIANALMAFPNLISLIV